MNETKHLVIGGGEIGQSMYRLLSEADIDVQIRDKESDIVGQFNYLHIAFGCTTQQEFIQVVRSYSTTYNPHTIIIHSTVAEGTVRQLGERAVHVPIRGRHPNLEEGMRTFRLYVGGNHAQRVRQVADIYRSLDIDVFQVDPNAYPPETTELLKLWCTTYYGLIILFEKELHRICKQAGVPFEIVYKDLNESYNAGYTKLGEKRFVRPVLEHRPGKTGGHCVVPNAKLLEQSSYLAKLIVQMNENFENPESEYYEL